MTRAMIARLAMTLVAIATIAERAQEGTCPNMENEELNRMSWVSAPVADKVTEKKSMQRRKPEAILVTTKE